MKLDAATKNISLAVIIISALTSSFMFLDARHVNASEYIQERRERIEDKIIEIEGDIEVLDSIPELTIREKLELAKLKNRRLKYLRKLTLKQ